MAPFFSVIIPVFNQEHIFTKCLFSIMSQDFKDFEVIITDDGSTDASASKISDFIKDDPRFRLISHVRNSSVLCARITGLRAAVGRYIAFIDIDDYVAPGYFSEIADSLSRNPVDVLRIGFIKEPSGERVPPVGPEDPLGTLLDCRGISALFTDIFGRSVIDRTLPFLKEGYCNMAEDFYLKTLAYSFAGSFGCLDRELYHYVTTDGMSNSTSGLSSERLAKQLGFIGFATSRMKEFLLAHDPAMAERVDQTAFTIMTSTMYQYGGPSISWRDLYSYMSALDNDQYEPVLNWMFEEFIPLRAAYIKGKV